MLPSALTLPYLLHVSSHLCYSPWIACLPRPPATAHLPTWESRASSPGALIPTARPSGARALADSVDRGVLLRIDHLLSVEQEEGWVGGVVDRRWSNKGECARRGVQTQREAHLAYALDVKQTWTRSQSSAGLGDQSTSCRTGSAISLPRPQCVPLLAANGSHSPLTPYRLAQWNLGSTLVTLGLTAREGIPITFAAFFVIGIILTLQGRVGAITHCSFPVLARASFGMVGAYLAIIVRTVLALREY